MSGDLPKVYLARHGDHDYHEIVTWSAGLLPPNQYLAVAIHYLIQHRLQWRKDAAIGKTVVSVMIDCVAARLGRRLYEVPVGFKWFVDGLLYRSLGFGGEESMGASFLRTGGSVWMTDKGGMLPSLLAAELAAHLGRDPGEIYGHLASEFVEPAFERVAAPATPAEKSLLSKLAPAQVQSKELAGRRFKIFSRKCQATALIPWERVPRRH